MAVYLKSECNPWANIYPIDSFQKLDHKFVLISSFEKLGYNSGTLVITPVIFAVQVKIDRIIEKVFL